MGPGSTITASPVQVSALVRDLIEPVGKALDRARESSDDRAGVLVDRLSEAKDGLDEARGGDSDSAMIQVLRLNELVQWQGMLTDVGDVVRAVIDREVIEINGVLRTHAATVRALGV